MPVQDEVAVRRIGEEAGAQGHRGAGTEGEVSLGKVAEERLVGGGEQKLLVITRTEQGLTTEVAGYVRFVPMTGKARASGTVFGTPASAGCG